MLIARLLGILLIMFLMPAAMAAGQEMPSEKWWYNPQIARNLNLTNQEIRRLDQLFDASRRDLMQLKIAVEREQGALDKLLNRKKVNDAEVQQQFRRLEQARTRLADERLRFVVEVRRIIGADRFQQLKQNYRKWGG
ncbi:MAG: periplasmic heavy metal sensor [Desulfobacterales bacterium]|nr:MAG: periplasmic heavy metal sensor [Desulfobacterales bacterium]